MSFISAKRSLVVVHNSNGEFEKYINSLKAHEHLMGPVKTWSIEVLSEWKIFHLRDEITLYLLAQLIRGEQGIKSIESHILHSVLVKYSKSTKWICSQFSSQWLWLSHHARALRWQPERAKIVFLAVRLPSLDNFRIKFQCALQYCSPIIPSFSAIRAAAAL